MDTCSKDTHGKHHMVALREFGDSKGKIVGAQCTKCGKTVNYSEKIEEESFPDLDK